MQFLKERNLLKKISYSLVWFFSPNPPPTQVSFTRMVCQSRRGNLENQQYEKGPHGLSKAAMMSFQFSSVTQRQSPVDGECRSVLVKHCESRWISGKKITSGSRYFPCLAPCCYIAWIRVPEYLCHKSMALVTMASVFSCGIWKRDWREISYKAHARREYVSGFEKLQRRGPTVHLSVLLGQGRPVHHETRSVEYTQWPKQVLSV